MRSICSNLSVLFVAILILTTMVFQSCSSTPKPVTVVALPDPGNVPWLAPKILNSDRIKAKFGSYGVNILLQDEAKGLRISNLYSMVEGDAVMRVLALVDFVPNMDKRLRAAHQDILAGGSIGSVLVKHHMGIDKQVIFKDNVSHLPPRKMQMAMRSITKKFAGIVYELRVKIGNELVPYCTITEIYSPAFLTFHDLEVIFTREQGGNGQSEISETIKTLMSSTIAEQHFIRINELVSNLTM